MASRGFHDVRADEKGCKLGSYSSCVLCTRKTIQRRRGNNVFVKAMFPDAASNSSSPTNLLRCCLCNRGICKGCAREICNISSTQASDIDPWFDVASKFGEGVIHESSHDFVGHCCEHRVRKSTSGGDRVSLPSSVSTSGGDRVSLPLSVSTSSCPSIDGTMYFPTCHLFITTSLNSIDIHSLGADLPHYKGVVHCVPSLDSVTTCQQLNVYPSPMNDCPWITKRTILIDTPLILGYESSMNLQKRLLIDIYEVQESLNISESKIKEMKGSNDIKPSVVKQSFIFDGKSQKNTRLTIILLVPRDRAPRSSNPLLLMRFHGPMYRLTEKTKKKLYERCLQLIPHNGIECHRKGGSSSKTRYDDTFFQFLLHESVFPRKSVAVKLVKHALYWECLYISPCSGRAVKHCYCPPVTGGIFRTTDALLVDFPFLLEFAESKVMAACILNEINRMDVTSFKIAVAATAAEIPLLEKAISSTEGTRLMNDSHDHPGRYLPNNTRKHILQSLSMDGHHTLVTHPVGYHVDVFSNGVTSRLENKICFDIPASRKTGSVGRGGAGSGRFVFAIIDW